LSVDEKSDVIADVELIERFSRDWQANARFYRQTLDELRNAARRLLLVLKRSSANHRALSNGMIQRLRNVEDEIACLGRQPLFFPEMFHGERLLEDGDFDPLNPDDRLHYRASGLLGIEDRVAVAEIYRRISQYRNLPLRVVEIGSAVGRGSTRIAGEFVKKSGGMLYCIDPWERSMYYIFLANLRIFELEGTVVPIRSPSVDAAAMFDDGSLDAVFVDGSHIYPNVLADIDAYLPKIRKNGILFGHDLLDVPSRFDRDELLRIASRNNAEANYTNSKGEVQRVDVHPGVILAVQDRFGDEVELFPGSVVWARQI
jgi:predicted O-methyltransferase YrrM